MDDWPEQSVAGPSCRRFEVFDMKGEKLLRLKEKDLNVKNLSRIFKITSQSIFLEDDITSHAEFPDDKGVFQVADMTTGTRYKVCGDSSVTESVAVKERPGSDNVVVNGNRPWSVERPWSAGGKNQQKSPLISKKTEKSATEPLFRRTFPFVSLTLDKTQRKILVDLPEENVYIRIPEHSVSIHSILSEMEKRINIPADELVILDSGCSPVTDDDKDLEYWRTPSRKLTIAKLSEYQDLAKKRKRLGLTLGKRRNAACSSRDDLAFEEEYSEKVGKLERTVDVVKETVDKVTGLLSKQTSLFECKICTNIPTNPVVTTCCNQILGCMDCYVKANQDHDDEVCPLCRSDQVSVIPLKGVEDTLQSLQRFNS